MTDHETILALRFNAPGEFAIETVARPVAGDGEVLVSPRYVGVCATDLEFLDGTHPYLQAGLATYPLQPGHEWSGVVVESNHAGFPPGTRVVGDPEVPCGRPDCEFCPHGRTPWCPDRREIGCRLGLAGAAATLVSLPATCLRAVPPGVDDRAAVLAEPALTVLGGLSRARDVARRRVLVIGAGTIGLIAAQVCASRGADVHVLVREGAPVDALTAFTTLVGSAGGGPVADYDLVISAAGSPDAFTSALRAVGNGGEVLLLGVPGELVQDVDVASILHHDATIHGVLNYSSAGPGTMAVALDLIAAGIIDASVLIDKVYPLAEAGDALARARDTARAHPKVLLSISEPR